MDYDVAIIGAGMSGLAAGIRLANFGKRTVVLERHNVLGGLNSFYKQAGRLFDVGLHAVTNWVPPGTKRAPLTKLLRQLRIRQEDFDLTPQRGSSVWFPGCRLRFDNDEATLEAEVAAAFPGQIDGFRRLVAEIRSDGGTDPFQTPRMAREALQDFLTDPLLREMLFCPLMYYGSAVEDDMDWGQFKIMFQSIFLEGFARPFKGVRTIIQVLRKKLLEVGGELRMKAGVASLEVRDGKVTELVLDSGEHLTAGAVLSSAGVVETLRMCSDSRGREDELPPAGQLGFMESISCLDCEPRDLGIEDTIIFFSTHADFAYRKPEGLLDVHSGVVCMPNNYAYEEPLPEGMVRVTNLANHERWFALPADEYADRKQECYQASVAHLVDEGVVPDFRPHVTYVDSFTPPTVKKFTFHDHGAIYGAPGKVRDGRTHLENLFLCGTDQGYLGIIGAMLSGISMANMHLVK